MTVVVLFFSKVEKYHCHVFRVLLWPASFPMVSFLCKVTSLLCDEHCLSIPVNLMIRWLPAIRWRLVRQTRKRSLGQLFFGTTQHEFPWIQEQLPEELWHHCIQHNPPTGKLNLLPLCNSLTSHPAVGGTFLLSPYQTLFSPTPWFPPSPCTGPRFATVSPANRSSWVMSDDHISQRHWKERREGEKPLSTVPSLSKGLFSNTCSESLWINFLKHLILKVQWHSH